MEESVRLLSTEELRQRRAEIKKLLKKDALSAAELKQFVYLFIDVKDGHTGFCDGLDVFVPSPENCRIELFVTALETNCVRVTLVDTGELFTLHVDEAGFLTWRAGFLNMFYSPFLGRTVEVDDDILDWPDVLGTAEHKKLAQALWDACE